MRHWQALGGRGARLTANLYGQYRVGRGRWLSPPIPALRVGVRDLTDEGPPLASTAVIWGRISPSLRSLRGTSASDQVLLTPVRRGPDTPEASTAAAEFAMMRLVLLLAALLLAPSPCLAGARGGGTALRNACPASRPERHALLSRVRTPRAAPGTSYARPAELEPSPHPPRPRRAADWATPERPLNPLEDLDRFSP
jgi:hypothetical protein